MYTGWRKAWNRKLTQFLESHYYTMNRSNIFLNIGIGITILLLLFTEFILHIHAIKSDHIDLTEDGKGRKQLFGPLASVAWPIGLILQNIPIEGPSRRAIFRALSVFILTCASAFDYGRDWSEKSNTFTISATTIKTLIVPLLSQILVAASCEIFLRRGPAAGKRRIADDDGESGQELPNTTEGTSSGVEMDDHRESQINQRPPFGYRPIGEPPAETLWR